MRNDCPSRFFNESRAAHDFMASLDRFQKIKHVRPRFRERLWLRALAEADEHDLARKMTDYYRSLDTQEFHAPTSSHHEKLYREAIGRMNKRAIRIVKITGALKYWCTEVQPPVTFPG